MCLIKDVNNATYLCILVKKLEIKLITIVVHRDALNLTITFEELKGKKKLII